MKSKIKEITLEVICVVANDRHYLNKQKRGPKKEGGGRERNRTNVYRICDTIARPTVLHAQFYTRRDGYLCASGIIFMHSLVGLLVTRH